MQWTPRFFAELLGAAPLTTTLTMALVVGACGGDSATEQDTEMPTGTGDGTTAAPECLADADCDECMTCEASSCVASLSCEGTAPECVEDSDCDPCQVCDGLACVETSCEDTSGGELCVEGQWCEEGVSWCDGGSCIDVPAPTMLPPCEDLPEFKAVVVQPQIQNRRVRWLDVDDAGAPPDLLAVAAGSLNSWLAPSWTLSKTALAHEGGAMDVLRGHGGPRVIEAAIAAQALGLHAVDNAGGFTALGTLELSVDVLDLVALDADGDGVDEAAARFDGGIVAIAVQGETLSEGAAIYGESTTDLATLRNGSGDQLVVGLSDGRSRLIGFGDAGQPVLDEGLTNPWGAELVVVFGGKYGLVGPAGLPGSALALSTSEPLSTIVAPLGAVSVAALDAAVPIIAVGGASELAIYPVGRAGPQCVKSINGGEFEAVALADLGGGTLGIAVIVDGEVGLYTLADVLG